MIPASFGYVKPDSVTEALSYLRQPDARVLAGGHSILTPLKQRILKTGLLVDISGLNLSAIESRSSSLHIGAMATQAKVMSACAGTRYHLLAEVGACAGDPSIRTRGTVVGAVCAIEPGGDWLAATLAMDASISVLTIDGEETVSVEEMVKAGGVPAGALVTSLTIPEPVHGAQSQYIKVKHAAIGWAIASAAIVRSRDFVRVAISGACRAPARLRQTEQALLKDCLDIEPALDTDLSRLTFVGDGYASQEYRRHRLKVLIKRALHD